MADTPTPDPSQPKPSQSKASQDEALKEKVLQQALKEKLVTEAMINGKKIKIISVDELKRFATRFGKISQFYFIGAVLMLSAGIHFAQQGSQLLPKIFLGILVFCVLMTLLSFRISYKAGKVVEMIGKTAGKKLGKK